MNKVDASFASGVVYEDSRAMAVILAVEDEDLVRSYLAEILRDAGHQVIEAENADQAITILEGRQDIEMIITDVNMPGSMDGMRLASVVRGRWPPIRSHRRLGRGRYRVWRASRRLSVSPKAVLRRPVLSAVEAPAA